MGRVAVAVAVAGWLVSSCGGARSGERPSAAAGTPAERVFRGLGLDRDCRGMDARTATAVDAVFKRQADRALARGFMAQLRAEATCADERAFVQEHLDPARAAEVVAFLESPAGQRVVAAIHVEDAEQIKRNAAALQARGRDEERAALFRDWAEADGSRRQAEEGVEALGRVGAMVAVAQASGVTVSMPRQLDEPRLARRLRAGTDMAEVMARGIAVLAVDLSTADVEAYVAFCGSPAGRHAAELKGGAVRHALRRAEARWLDALLADPAMPRDYGALVPADSWVEPCADPRGCQAECDRGQGDACTALGVSVSTGRAGRADPVGARELWTRACELGSAHGCNLLAREQHARDGDDESVTAEHTYQRACQLGLAMGCANATRLRIRRGGADVDRARLLHELAARCTQTDGTGCMAAAFLAVEAPRARQDPAAAAAALERGCRLGDLAACRVAGDTFYLGWGPLARDPARAVSFYRPLCEEKNDGHACNNWADMMENGVGGPVDIPRAITLYERACRAGATIGCISIGALYRDGKGVPRDRVRAAQMFDRACAAGDRRACAELEDLRHGD